MNLANTTVEYNASPVEIRAALNGKFVTYLNEGLSTVSPSGIRHFRILSIENIFVAKKTGRRCVDVYTSDHQDGGNRKFRRLHLAGITNIA